MDAPLPGKATFTFWLLAALLLLIVALIGFSLFGPNPPIEPRPTSPRRLSLRVPLPEQGAVALGAGVIS